MKKSYSFIMFKRLWPYIKPYRLILLLATIGLVLNGAVDAGLLALIKPLLDNGLMDKEYTLIMWIAAGIVFLIAIRGITNYISNYALAWISGKVVMNFRQLVFAHYLKLPASYHDQKAIGDQIAVITYNAEMVSQASSNALIIIVRELIYGLGLLCVMFYGNWRLAVIILIVIPVVVYIANFIAKRIKGSIRKIQSLAGQITTETDQMLKGHKEVLIYNAQESEKQHFTQTTNDARKTNLKMLAISSLSSPITQIFAGIGLGIVIYIVARSYLEITPGSFTLVFSSMVALMRPMRELTTVHVQLQQGWIGCESLFAVLDLPPEKDEGTQQAEQIKGKIEFQNVTFSYPDQTEPALKNVSFTITPNEKVAFVGRSGSGKTTIISLLTRFYAPQSGQILLDDVPIEQYQLRSYRSQFGLVSQQTHLFHDSILNNIAYGSQNFTLEQMIEAAQKAHAMEFIDKLEDGLETIVGDNGSRLSGGQKQRIAIARVLLRNSPILILDEATSALDNQSEKIVQQAFGELAENRTSLTIAHRLSTIQNVDRIFVLDNGQIVEEGSPQALLAKKGIYAQMYEAQFRETKSRAIEDRIDDIAQTNLNEENQ